MDGGEDNANDWLLEDDDVAGAASSLVTQADARKAHINDLRKQSKVISFKVPLNMRASSIATDVAQVVLMSGSLAEMDHLMELAQRLKKNLVMTITSYTTVVIVSFTSIVFLGAPPFLALIIQSTLNNTYGLTQALLPLKQLRDHKKRELEKEKQELLEARA